MASDNEAETSNEKSPTRATEENDQIITTTAATSVNEYGDDFTDFSYDADEASDEEIAPLMDLRIDWEVKEGIKFSKKALVAYIDDFFEKQCTA